MVWQKIEYVKAVDGVSLEIKQGETVGLVGESGCGKSTTGYSIMRLYKPTSGKIIYDGVDIAGMSAYTYIYLPEAYADDFQDPYASLNPE